MSEPTSTPVNGTIAAREREVERNREQLAQTVDALHARLDVKTRAKARLQETKNRATTSSGRPRPVVVAGAAAALAAVVALIWWRRS